MNYRSIYMISAQILLALTLIACTVIVANTVKTIKFGRGIIQVKGCAEKEIRSDFVKMNGMIQTSAVALLDAYLKLEKDRDILQNYLKAKGSPQLKSSIDNHDFNGLSIGCEEASNQQY